MGKPDAVLVLDKVNPAGFTPNPASDVWNQKVSIDKNERVLITGSSGSGKTTLALSIAGVRSDYSGSIFFNGSDIGDESADESSTTRRTGVSFVFQDLKLFDSLTARENIDIKSRLNPDFEPERIDGIASLLGIRNLLQKKCGTLSRGERQRLVILRSLCQNFSLLVLDEPFSHLDDKNSHIAAKILLEECASREAALLVLDLAPNDFFPYSRKLSL